LVAIALYFFARYTATNASLILWLAGLTLFVCGFAATLPRPSFKISRREALILAFILLVALLMRTYRLGSMPPGVYLDEADNGLWALRFIKESYSPFTEHRDSNATLFFYFLALGLKMLGLNVLSMRWVAVAIGMVTVLAFYFLGRLLFGVRPAQLACALLAVSCWHVHFSRMVFEAILVPLFEVLTLYFLWKGLTAKSRSNFAWAGLAFGLGFHT
jgi:predicted membrane-bound mannosyltransferase